MRITHEDMLQAVPCAGQPDTCMEGVPSQGLNASPMRAVYNKSHGASKALCRPLPMQYAKLCSMFSIGSWRNSDEVSLCLSGK